MANLSLQVWQFHPFVKWQGTGDDLTWTSSSLGPCSLLPHWLLGSFQPPELQACEELERGESHSASSRVWRVRSELAWRQNIPRLHHIKKDGEACPHLRLNCWCQDNAPGLPLQLSDITRAPCPVTRETWEHPCFRASAVPVQEVVVPQHPQEARGVGDRVKLFVHLLQLLLHDVSSLTFCLTAGTGPVDKHQRAFRKGHTAVGSAHASHSVAHLCLQPPPSCELYRWSNGSTVCTPALSTCPVERALFSGCVAGGQPQHRWCCRPFQRHLLITTLYQLCVQSTAQKDISR